MASLMDMLGGMSGGPQPGMMSQAPPTMSAEQGDTEDSGSLPQKYRDLLAEIQAVFDIEPDEADRAVLTKLMVQVQTLIARNQQDQQKLMGGDPTLSRALLKHG